MNHQKALVLKKKLIIPGPGLNPVIPQPSPKINDPMII